MGISVRLNFLKSTPYSETGSPLGAVLAFFKATIHESYLDWVPHKLPQLTDRITHARGLYLFKGPVFILPPTASPLLIKIGLTAGTALVATFILTRVVKRVRKIFGTVITGALTTYSAWLLFSKIIPSAPGIYLLSLSFSNIKTHSIVIGR